MHAVTRRVVFESNDFRIGHVVARPSSPECGEVECQNENVLVLPLAGVFAKHEDSRRRAVVTPNDAGLIATGKPYRISYPAGVGDRCLTLRFSDNVIAKVLPQATMPRGSAPPRLASSALLPPAVMLARSLLCHRLAGAHGDPLEVEELGSCLLASTLRVMLRDGRCDPPRRLRTKQEHRGRQGSHFSGSRAKMDAPRSGAAGQCLALPPVASVSAEGRGAGLSICGADTTCQRARCRTRYRHRACRHSPGHRVRKP